MSCCTRYISLKCFGEMQCSHKDHAICLSKILLPSHLNTAPLKANSIVIACFRW